MDSRCTPGFSLLDDAPFTMTEISRLPPAPLLEDAPLALKEVSYYDFGCEIASGKQTYLLNRKRQANVPAKSHDYIGEDFIATTEQHIETFYIGEEFGEDLLIDAEEEARRDAQAIAQESGPFTAAQNSELDRIMNTSIMKILDPFIDLVIGKCQTFVTTQVQNAFEPVCDDLRQQIKALQNEFVYKQAPVHVRLKRYCFKRSDASKVAGSELVRYFEKLVRDEVSTSNSAPDLSDSNLMHSDKFIAALQDCTDFDEPTNDFHSTAACAQLLQYSLSGSQEPTP